MRLCCKGGRTLGNVSLSFRGGRVATLVKPDKYKGSACLEALGQVGSLVPSIAIAKGVDFGSRSVCDPRVSAMRLEGGINVIFRRPGPFPFSIFSGITCNLHVTKVGSGRGVTQVIRRDLGGTTM